MLVPEHPKPVSRRRAVAEMTVAARQAATIPPGHVLVLDAAPPKAPEPPAVAATPPVAGESPPVSPDRHVPPI